MPGAYLKRKIIILWGTCLRGSPWAVSRQAASLSSKGPGSLVGVQVWFIQIFSSTPSLPGSWLWHRRFIEVVYSLSFVVLPPLQFAPGPDLQHGLTSFQEMTISTEAGFHSLAWVDSWLPWVYILFLKASSTIKSSHHLYSTIFIIIILSVLLTTIASSFTTCISAQLPRGESLGYNAITCQVLSSPHFLLAIGPFQPIFKIPSWRAALGATQISIVLAFVTQRADLELKSSIILVY